jgi:hypothetical protein
MHILPACRKRELSPPRLAPSSFKRSMPGNRGGSRSGGGALLRRRSAQIYKYDILRGVVGGGP